MRYMYMHVYGCTPFMRDWVYQHQLVPGRKGASGHLCLFFFSFLYVFYKSLALMTGPLLNPYDSWQRPLYAPYFIYIFVALT